MKLFCLPYAGGSSSTYMPWKDIASNFNIEIFPLDYLGHGLNINKTISPSFQKNLSFLFQEITNNLKCDDKFCIFGHSLGALFAYELCKKFEISKRKKPNHIYLSAIESPQFKNNILFTDNSSLKAVLRKYGATPDEILNDDSIFSFFMPIIVNDFNMYNDYEFSNSPILSTPASLMYGTSDFLKLSNITAWKNLFSSHIDFFPFQGDHFFINHEYCELLNIINSTWSK